MRSGDEQLWKIGTARSHLMGWKTRLPGCRPQDVYHQKCNLGSPRNAGLRHGRVWTLLRLPAGRLLPVRWLVPAEAAAAAVAGPQGARHVAAAAAPKPAAAVEAGAAPALPSRQRWATRRQATPCSSASSLQRRRPSMRWGWQQWPRAQAAGRCPRLRRGSCLWTC